MFLSVPVAERVAVFRFPRMDSETFERVRLAWKALMTASGHEEEVIDKWSAKLPTPEAGKVPDLSKTVLNLSKIHRFWCADKTFCTQVFPDCLTFNIVSRPGVPGSYQQLHDMTLMSLPNWNEIANTAFNEIAVQYINGFKTSHLDMFTSKENGTIRLGEAFTLFTLPSQLGTQIKFPYRHDFTLDHGDSAVPCNLSVNAALNQLPKPVDPKANVCDINFLAQHVPRVKNLSIEEIGKILNALHSEIAAAFKVILKPAMLEVCGISQ